MKIYEGKGYNPPKTVLNDQIVRLSVSEGITREQAVLQLWQREKPLTTEEYEQELKREQQISQLRKKIMKCPICDNVMVTLGDVEFRVGGLSKQVTAFSNLLTGMGIGVIPLSEMSDKLPFDVSICLQCGKVELSLSNEKLKEILREKRRPLSKTLKLKKKQVRHAENL